MGDSLVVVLLSLATVLAAAMGFWLGYRAARRLGDARECFAQAQVPHAEEVTGGRPGDPRADDRAECHAHDRWSKDRGRLDAAIATQLAAMSRYDVGFSLALFEIDRCPGVDDPKGRRRGERVLRRLARLLEDSVRETDTVAHLSARAFAVAMPQTDFFGACELADRLRRTVEQQTPLTLSAGVVAAMDGDTKESLLARAELARQGASAAGGNCVVSHDGQRPESFSAELSTPLA